MLCPYPFALLCVNPVNGGILRVCSHACVYDMYRCTDALLHEESTTTAQLHEGSSPTVPSALAAGRCLSRFLHLQLGGSSEILWADAEALSDVDGVVGHSEAELHHLAQLLAPAFASAYGAEGLDALIRGSACV